MDRPIREFSPTKLSPSEFMRSNVFVAWSRRVDRDVELIGPHMYDAWLILEFDPSISWFCERPPVQITLLGLKRTRAIDFWIQRRSGEHKGIVLHASAGSKECAVDLLQRSITASKLNCEIWPTADLKHRAVYVKNLKALQPFIAMSASSNEKLASSIIEKIQKLGNLTWSEVRRSFLSHFEDEVNAEIARLIHAGRIAADLEAQPLSGITQITLP